MKCIKLQLQERTKIRPKSEPRHNKPRRYCQKLLVAPKFDENFPCAEVVKRFHGADCDIHVNNRNVNDRFHNDTDNIFLSVQNLQFKGQMQENKRPRTSFKYKTVTDGQKHRMFVKQVVDEDITCVDEECTSELTCYYFDDYVKYYIGNDRSRTCSDKSSIMRENESGQANFKTELTKKEKSLVPLVTHNDETLKTVENNEIEEERGKGNKFNTSHSKIAFHKRGKRKSITISQSASPETVQVIRVDVVCNYSCSSTMSEYEDNKNQNRNNETFSVETKKEKGNTKREHYANKYLLTNTIKALDENVSGGANVTLLCKTFRLTDRINKSHVRKY